MIAIGIRGQTHVAYSVSRLESLVEHDGLHAIRTRRDHVDGNVADFRDAFQITTGVHRQLIVLGDTGSGFRPTRQFLEDGFRFHHGICAVWQHVQELATIAIADTNLERFEAIEHIKLGDTETIDAVDHHRPFHGRPVEPATATWTPGHGTEFLAD